MERNTMSFPEGISAQEALKIVKQVQKQYENIHVHVEGIHDTRGQHDDSDLPNKLPFSGQALYFDTGGHKAVLIHDNPFKTAGYYGGVHSKYSNSTIHYIVSEEELAHFDETCEQREFLWVGQSSRGPEITKLTILIDPSQNSTYAKQLARWEDD